MSPLPELDPEDLAFLMGDHDEVDVFFIVTDEQDPVIMQVQGLPEDWQAWIH